MVKNVTRRWNETLSLIGLPFFLTSVAAILALVSYFTPWEFFYPSQYLYSQFIFDYSSIFVLLGVFFGALPIIEWLLIKFYKPSSILPLHIFSIYLMSIPIINYVLGFRAGYVVGFKAGYGGGIMGIRCGTPSIGFFFAVTANLLMLIALIRSVRVLGVKRLVSKRSKLAWLLDAIMIFLIGVRAFGGLEILVSPSMYWTIGSSMSWGLWADTNVSEAGFAIFTLGATAITLAALTWWLDSRTSTAAIIICGLMTRFLAQDFVLNYNVQFRFGTSTGFYTCLDGSLFLIISNLIIQLIMELLTVYLLPSLQVERLKGLERVEPYSS